jgi:lysophospholipase L1-like esterase
MTTRHVVCIGDSITNGRISVNYLDLLAGRPSCGSFVFTNAGVNGDLAETVLRRLDPVIAMQPDLATVLIGTNDANASMSKRSSDRAVRMKKLTKPLTIEGFGAIVDAIVDRLTGETRARVGLLSIPVLGEELGSESMRRSQQYSETIKRVAEAHGVEYLPLNERQTELLEAGGLTPGTPYRDGVGLLATGAMQHVLLRRSLDDISRRRGLALSTDLIHQNTRGATMIADLIEEFISQ